MSLLRLAPLRRTVSAVVHPIRTLATVVPSSSLSKSNTTPEPTEGRLRPRPNVEINPDHGLWAFFRKGEDGKVFTLEPAHKRKDFSGRAWTAAELRRKNFKDLHILWYSCLRERNLLATQRAEFRRLEIPVDPTFTNLMDKDKRVRKTMKHIKLVLNERRLAYEKASELWKKAQEEKKAPESSQMPVPDAEPTPAPDSV
ncbi:54S ribosomal protein L4 mitochondrial [Tulasnella sp. 403]|nr:54S ribosomal protein L4 mitochondrial [Tulasnella sp. 403]